MDKKKVLVVGSGGIGCELAKLLYLSKCGDVTIVDFDTIELTNLNRQFLFTAADIKRHKASVAAEQYMSMLPCAKVTVHTESVYGLGVAFFRSFDLVFTCLDNDDARAYVSMCCTFVCVPLVDGGSTGLLGQALYFDHTTECFSCVPRKQKKEVPVCTIRSFPTEFSHCVVWAKEHFLGEMFAAGCKDHADPYAERMRLEVEAADGHKVGETEMKMLNELFATLAQRESVVFDKDDEVVMRFVHHCATARAVSFGLNTESYFVTQNIAGNIVPSVCTTNAIVASLMLASAGQKCNFFVSRGKHLLIRVETCERDALCSFCSARMLVFCHDGNATVRVFRDLVTKAFGSCSEVYTSTTLIYDRYYTNNLNNYLPTNEFVYAKTQGATLVVHSHVGSSSTPRIVLANEHFAQ